MGLPFAIPFHSISSTYSLQILTSTLPYYTYTLFIIVLHTGEILSLVACSGKSQYSSIWSVNLLSNDSDYYSDDTQQVVKQIRWLPPQTSNNHNSAAGCYFLLLNNDNIVCLSPSGAQGGYICHSVLYRTIL